MHDFSDNLMTLFQFISGLTYYAALPIAILDDLQRSISEPSSHSEFPVFTSALAVIVFCIGSFTQHTAHVQLAGLRSVSKPGEQTKYFIPRGRLFDLVSCPHYLSEIVIYFSFLILTSASNICILFTFGFVVLNLSHCAVLSHQWYHSKFPKYPTHRKALIPFVF